MRKALSALMIATWLTNLAIYAETPAKTVKKKLPAWNTAITGAKQMPGLFSLFFKADEQKLLMEIKPEQFNKEILFPIAIARGVGDMLIGGDTLNFGNQWVLSFRRVGNNVHVIRKNMLFRANAGTPQADAVKVSYTDSVIAAVPVRSESGKPAKVLIDLGDLLMGDLAGMGVTPDRKRSTWYKVKAFPKNLEIEVSLVFKGKTKHWWDWEPEVPDARGTQVVLHYGLSMLPGDKTYKPRIADDRVGHFLSVVKDYSNDLSRSAFTRLVTRWKLEKSDANAPSSPPKEPIIFWIEKTVPREYRPFVKAGILEWNKAFERIGFIDAIQVRDQQAGDDIDPEDIRYNTFRWITASSGFARGPSRTNPKTGQILDADIIFDEGMVRYWREQYLRVAGIPQGVQMLERGQRQAWMKIFASEIPWMMMNESALDRWVGENFQGGRIQSEDSAIAFSAYGRGHEHEACMLGPGMRRQLGLLASVLVSRDASLPGGRVPKEFLGQAIKEVVMHEVGHTLGLRHNFKASSTVSLADSNDPSITREKGMSGSVMDYLPANLVPKGQKQGEYFSSTIGPYDIWAIEYAYRPFKANEPQELSKIASKAATPGLDFASDQDMRDSPDPSVQLFDLGDPLDYAKQRIQLVESYIGDLTTRVVEKGEGWQRGRSAFNYMIGELFQSAQLASFYIGSEYVNRDHREDPNARTPFEVVPAARQREALNLLKSQILSGKVFNFSPENLRNLAPDFWRHWGTRRHSQGYQYPLEQMVLRIQMVPLQHCLDASVLHRVQNVQLKSGKDDALKMSEIFNALTESIWAGFDVKAGPEQQIATTIYARNLQREHFKRLAQIVLGSKAQQGGFFSFVFDSPGDVPA
ncbi:MAG: zinc-dependent metalloprotease, partial [Planctomycetota bacterium]|nr:zinc-dependent metalloprotease [Planctomycetota bacterium]